jgi:hypothetical protein
MQRKRKNNSFPQKSFYFFAPNHCKITTNTGGGSGTRLPTPGSHRKLAFKQNFEQSTHEPGLLSWFLFLYHFYAKMDSAK